jgi:hypothetical protein
LLPITQYAYSHKLVTKYKSVLVLSFALGLVGTLVEATGRAGREAAKAYHQGGISFRWLNHQLMGK